MTFRTCEPVKRHKTPTQWECKGGTQRTLGRRAALSAAGVPDDRRQREGAPILGLLRLRRSGQYRDADQRHRRRRYDVSHPARRKNGIAGPAIFYAYGPGRCRLRRGYQLRHRAAERPGTGFACPVRRDAHPIHHHAPSQIRQRYRSAEDRLPDDRGRQRPVSHQ